MEGNLRADFPVGKKITFFVVNSSGRIQNIDTVDYDISREGSLTIYQPENTLFFAPGKWGFSRQTLLLALIEHTKQELYIAEITYKDLKNELKRLENLLD